MYLQICTHTAAGTIKIEIFKEYLMTSDNCLNQNVLVYSTNIDEVFNEHIDLSGDDWSNLLHGTESVRTEREGGVLRFQLVHQFIVDLIDLGLSKLGQVVDGGHLRQRNVSATHTHKTILPFASVAVLQQQLW